jgi:hypothetical protein
MQTPCIHTYYASKHLPATPAALVCLSNLAVENLTALSIWVRPDTDNVFPVLAALRNLHELYAHFLAAPWAPSTAHPWSMPSLLSVVWSYLEPSVRMLRFLAQCASGAGCKLYLEIAGLASTETHLLKPFFAYNSFDVVRLALPSGFLAPLALEIADQPFVVFLNGCVPPLGTLTKLPKVLAFHFPSGADKQDAFWAFLEDLAVPVHSWRWSCREGCLGYRPSRIRKRNGRRNDYRTP